MVMQLTFGALYISIKTLMEASVNLSEMREAATQENRANFLRAVGSRILQGIEFFVDRTTDLMLIGAPSPEELQKRRMRR